jgi:cobalamin biosynthesis protein CobD/CbiB
MYCRVTCMFDVVFPETKKKVNPAGYWTRVARFIVERASHTKASQKGGDALVLLISLWYSVVQYEFTRGQSAIY